MNALDNLASSFSFVFRSALFKIDCSMSALCYPVPRIVMTTFLFSLLSSLFSLFSFLFLAHIKSNEPISSFHNGTADCHLRPWECRHVNFICISS